MLRVEARNAEVPIERKPEWIKTKAKMGPEYQALHTLVAKKQVVQTSSSAGKTVKRHS